MKSSCSTPRRASALALVVLAAMTPLSAATYIWDGGGVDGNFLNAANWNNSDTLPLSATDSFVQFAGSANTNVVLDSDFEVQFLKFNSGAASFNLSGTGEISIFGAGAGGISGTDQGINNGGASAQTITNNIRLTGNTQIYAVGGKLTLDGNINTNGKQVQLRAFSSDARLVLDGVISGTPGGVIVRGTSGAGVVELNAANTFTQTMQVWEGTVIASNNASFGNSANEVRLGINNAAIIGDASILASGSRTIGQGFRLMSKGFAGDYIIGGNSADVSTYSGNIIVHSTGTAASQTAMGLRVTAATGGRVNFTGNIIRQAAALGSGDTLTKVGGGIVALEGSGNIYSGETLVSEGTLLVNGELAAGGAAVTVQNGANFGGEGVVNRAINVLAGASFSAGDIDAGGASMAGVFTAGGALTFANTSVINFDLGTVSDHVSVAGAFTLDGVLNITALEGFGIGTYSLFSYAGSFVNGTLDLGDTPAGFNYALDFSTVGQVNLEVTAIPEPSAAALLTAGAALGLAGLRRRRRSIPGVS